MGYCQDFEGHDALDFTSEPPRCSRTQSEMPEAVRFPARSSRTQLPIGPPAEGASGEWCHATPSVSRISPEMDIPCLSRPGSEAFLVTSSCKSICKNYSDLLIGGDQVMPLSLGDLGAIGGADLANGPFLQSCEIPPAMESPQASPEFPQKPLQGDSCWRAGSGKDRSFLLHGGRPLSNSQLNEYLEQKLLDLYRQYMVESMVHNGSPSTVLASELILTSVDQITLQLSREQNLETAKAKDMVISCLLRVASGLPSSEISTPQLQISEDLA